MTSQLSGSLDKEQEPSPQSSMTTLDDVAGCEEAKAELEEVVDYLQV
jgi:ATP-dependent Zn protease